MQAIERFFIMNNTKLESSNNERRELLARVAHLYHKEDLSQGEISEILKVSRSSVSRILQEALEEGIIG